MRTCVSRACKASLFRTILARWMKRIKTFQTAEAYIRSVLASQPENRTAIFRSAQIAHDRMLLARLNGRSEQALAFARSSADWLEKFRAEKTDAPEASSILNTYFNVADQHMLGQQDQEALRLCSRGAEICRVLENKSYVGMFIEVSAEVLRRRGDLDEARKQIQEAVRKLDVGPPYTGPAMQANLVLALIKEGRILGEDDGVSLARPEEAIVPLERAFHIADDFVHRDPDDQNSRGRLAMAESHWPTSCAIPMPAVRWISADVRSPHGGNEGQFELSAIRGPACP